MILISRILFLNLKPINDEILAMIFFSNVLYFVASMFLLLFLIEINSQGDYDVLFVYIFLVLITIFTICIIWAIYTMYIGLSSVPFFISYILRKMKEA